MTKRIAVIIALLAFAAAAAACTRSQAPVEPSPVEAPVTDSASGSRAAPGLYDLTDGTVQAIGTLEHRDLEGGFWAVIDRTEAAGDEGTVVAVIANADKFTKETEQLEGLGVIAVGTRLKGASIRMAGPEIEATRIIAADDTAGPAE